jgi:RNA polymerase-binding protein DksA
MHDRVMADREATIQRVASLERDFARMVESTPAGNDDEHDPEGTTIAFERAQLVAVLEQARRHLMDLDDALDRMHENRYGTCESCGGPIGAARLDARPVARTCINCASVGSHAKQ